MEKESEKDMVLGFAKVNGGRLYYELTGEGHPLVLLHAGGMNRKMWDEQFELFAKFYRVIRYDARGVGDSDLPHEPFSLSEDLYMLLTWLGISKASLLGLSLGGVTAIDFCLQHPEMVGALILVSSGMSGYVFSQQYQQKIARIISAAKEGGVSAFVQAFLEDPTLAPAKEFAAARQKVAEMLTENYKAFSVDPGLARPPEPPAVERLSEITVPTLIMTGERDDADIHEMGRMLRENIESSQQEMISGAGHMINLERPEEFSRIVLDFLTSIYREKPSNRALEPTVPVVSRGRRGSAPNVRCSLSR